MRHFALFKEGLGVGFDNERGGEEDGEDGCKGPKGVSFSSAAVEVKRLRG